MVVPAATEEAAAGRSRNTIRSGPSGNGADALLTLLLSLASSTASSASALATILNVPAAFSGNVSVEVPTFVVDGPSAGTLRLPMGMAVARSSVVPVIK